MRLLVHLRHALSAALALTTLAAALPPASAFATLESSKTGSPLGRAFHPATTTHNPSSEPRNRANPGGLSTYDAATGANLWAAHTSDVRAYLPLARNGSPVADSDLRVYAGQMTIATYDWPKGLYPSSPSDPIYPYPYIHQEWQYYAAPKTYDVVVLENAHVRVTVLPEIGGRVIRWQDKHTGRLLTYANPVIKPAMRWGYRGWWLGTGGVEWAFPVDEHGLNEYRPWQAEMLSGDGWRGVRVSDVDSRTGLTVEVTLRLYAGRSDLEIAPSIANGTGQPHSFQFWINAMLTLSGMNAPSSGLRFWMPTPQVMVHSTGDGSLPPPRGLMSWPVYDGRDFSRYPTWSRYLGIFAVEANGAAGAYDEWADQGIVRSYPPEIAKGVKLFNLGDIGSAQYTDDNSRYFELWGGYNRTFFPEDYAPIADGQTLAWTERWYPVSGIGGLNWADAGLAAFVRATPGGVAVGLGAPAATSARLVLRQNGDVRASWDVGVGPGAPFRVVYPGSGSGWELEVWRDDTLAARIPAAP